MKVRHARSRDISLRAVAKHQDVHHTIPISGTVPRSGVGTTSWVVVLIVAILIPNILWVIRDHAPWPWDQAWYGEVSVDLWFNLTHSTVDWARTMMNGVYDKPPGIVWVGQFFVPFRYLCGSVENALLLSILLTQAAILYLIFQIARRIAPGSNIVPALGVSLAASTQSFVGLSHQYFVEPLQALAVTWVILVAVWCSEWPPPRTLLHLAAALILGLMAKAPTPLYCLLPCLYIGYVLIHKPLWQGWKDELHRGSAQALGAFVFVATPITALWYLENLKDVWQHIREASSGAVALNYGFHASIGHKFIVWLGLLNQAFLSPYLGWVLVLAAIVGIVACFGSGARRTLTASIRVTLVLSVLQCGLLLLTFSASDTVDDRYLYALLPLLLVIVMGLCALITSWAVLVLIVAICGLQFATVYRVALGTTAPPARHFNYLVKPEEDRRRFDEVERVVRMTSTVPGRYNIVGVQLPWLSANTAAFFAAKHRLDSGIRSYFTSLGFLQSDLGAAKEWVEQIQTMYYITLDQRFQPNPPDFLNVVSLPMLRQIEMDPHFEQVGPPSANGVLIFRRR